MFPLSLSRISAAALLCVCAAAAHAADFSLSGDLVYNSDLARVNFDIGGSAGKVRIWTDSWRGGLNFDPTAAVWRQSGSGYTLVAENDDNDAVGAGQGSFDAGFVFSSLAQGHYLVTVGASPNFALGAQLSDGFTYDGTPPIKIADWNQPSYDINANDQKGTSWSLQLTGVQVAAVPEPSSYAMMLAGVGMVMLIVRRRRLEASSHARPVDG